MSIILDAIKQANGGYETVWLPIPDSSQELAISCPAEHILYEGARGPGKTITQVMMFRRLVGLGYGEHLRGIIFDREFDNLAGLVAESKKWFPKFEDGCKFLESPSAYKWVWPTGEELLFRHVKKKSDYDGFHGHEYPFIGWNELTKQPTSELYDKFMSVNRCSFTPERDTPKNKDGSYATPDGKPLPKIPLIVFSTTNPNGPGHNWVKRRFIDPVPRGHILRTEVAVFNPQTQQDEMLTVRQVAIFGSYRENIYLRPEYVAQLESITDPNLRKAWLDGDWDIVTGGALDDVFDKSVHVIPRFVVPSSWEIDRAFDWGSSHPFSVGWFAQANGEEATVIVGNEVYKFCPPAGSIIQLAEWYGCQLNKQGQPDIGSNKGLKLSAKDIAVGIKNREISLMRNGWISSQPKPGPADNQIRDVSETDVETIEKKMLEEGIKWVESDKSPGSRRNGLQIMRDMFENAKRGEGPGLYFMDNCRASISIIPVLPRDEDKIDDVDTTSEDHCYDMVRYRALRGANRLAKKLTVNLPT